MRKKIVFLLAFLCMLLLAGCSNGKETSKYNIEYLNKDKTGIVAVPYDASATTKDALIEEFFAALSSDPDNVEYRKPIPNDVEITKYSLDGALLTIYFDADYLNMNREVYRRYEKGIREIPEWALIKLAGLYGVSTDYILGLTDEPGQRA